MVTTEKLYSLNYSEAKTYLFAVLFIAGNMILPQLFHLIPGGGLTWLPIYFFTLVAAYKYGLKVGLLTAILSPLLNSVLFGMPVASLLPVIVIKSVLFAVGAAYVAKRTQRVSFWGILVAILFYQIIGVLAEWLIVGDLYVAFQDFRIGIPGMLLQLFGGYFLLRGIAKL